MVYVMALWNRSMSSDPHLPMERSLARAARGAEVVSPGFALGFGVSGVLDAFKDNCLDHVISVSPQTKASMRVNPASAVKTGWFAVPVRCDPSLIVTVMIPARRLVRRAHKTVRQPARVMT